MPPTTDPKTSVFINCPFDAEFEPLMRVIVLATVTCGFLPRSAIESGSVAKARLDRILETIFDSRYSIHDLSRCHAGGAEGLARFNMPLELGMAMARRHAAPADHDWLVLVPHGHAHLQYVSDLAGIDPKKHDGTALAVAAGVMSWLGSRPDSRVIPHTPPDIIAWLPEFADIWSADVAAWREIRWWTMVEEARKIVLAKVQS